LEWVLVSGTAAWAAGMEWAGVEWVLAMEWAPVMDATNRSF
jgi:hypothetical protein